MQSQIQVMEQVALMDNRLAGALADGRLQLIASGNGCPLIDLGQVSAELAREAESADLVILEGMGRALQSNHVARFKCDVMKLAMVKDAHVAAKLGCPLMACFCRYEARK
jgi:type II pantothenate kinase